MVKGGFHRVWALSGPKFGLMYEEVEFSIREKQTKM